MSDTDDPAFMDALWAGARGALLSDHPGRAPATVRAAIEGHMALPREMTALLVSTAVRQHQMLSGDGLLSQLTVRERQVLQLLSEGRSTGEVARALVVAPVTIRSHISGILHKLNASSRQEAINLLGMETPENAGSPRSSR
jgi:DNA-binding NarL/FixJ family response regulator